MEKIKLNHKYCLFDDDEDQYFIIREDKHSYYIIDKPGRDLLMYCPDVVFDIDPVFEVEKSLDPKEAEKALIAFLRERGIEIA